MLMYSCFFLASIHVHSGGTMTQERTTRLLPKETLSGAGKHQVLKKSRVSSHEDTGKETIPY